jgi:hypothetical protein
MRTLLGSRFKLQSLPLLAKFAADMQHLDCHKKLMPPFREQSYTETAESSWRLRCIADPATNFCLDSKRLGECSLSRFFSNAWRLRAECPC